MNAIKIELKPRPILGYILLAIGLVVILYTSVNAMVTYNSVNETFSEIQELIDEGQFEPSTITEEIETPIFTETLFWFFMLVVLLTTGSLVANLGIKLIKV